MDQPRRQNRFLSRVQAERAILGKLAWAGIFLSLVAFAYHLSGLFIVFGACAFFLLASYHLKYHIDVTPQPRPRRGSKVFEYTDASLSHDPLLPSNLEDRQTIHPLELQAPTQPPSLIKTLRRHLDQDSEHAQQPIRVLAKVALQSFDEAYHGHDGHRRNEYHICMHRARKWEDLEELRECPNCRQRYEEALMCQDCEFMSCPDCRYFMPPAGWEASFGRLKKEGFGGAGLEDGW